ncbi:hypothetical protein FOG51_00065 [Hanseniaspora uvarum]|nr:hypothetical protein FOG51_00065 [Hanseniaspora uvarum]KAF0277026.1 hypothetical protein FOG50_02082 [Hanseniaspora uvarum]KKA01541.1 Mitochondrial 2-oxodicarboxylate carrier 2 [Hanseniaspora uvarum DSM 2768]
MSEKKTLSPLYSITAGTIAGISECLVFYPLDVTKTLIQLQKGTAVKQSTFTVLKDIFKKGVAYKGISSPLAMEGFKRSIKFGATTEFKKFYHKLNPTFFKENSVNVNIASGITSGIIEGFVITPFELVKVRLQDPLTKFKAPKDCLNYIIKQEGYFKLFSTGLEASALRQSVWNAAYFGSIPWLKSIIIPKSLTKQDPKYDQKMLFSNFLAGTIGGLLASTVNIPFDVVKSRVQGAITEEAKLFYSSNSFVSIYKIAKTEGIKTLFAGWTPKVMRLAPGGGLMFLMFEGMMSFFKKMNGIED